MSPFLTASFLERRTWPWRRYSGARELSAISASTFSMARSFRSSSAFTCFGSRFRRRSSAMGLANSL